MLLIHQRRPNPLRSGLANQSLGAASLLGGSNLSRFSPSGLLGVVLVGGLVFGLGHGLPLRAATHSTPPPDLCVLAPRVEPVDEGEAYGDVPTASPTLLVQEPLQQVRIESADGRLLWSRRAAPGRALPVPLAWPLSPLRSDQQVLLRLQPLGSSGDAFAHVRLRAASAARLASTAALIQTLGANPDAWMLAFNRALQSGDVPLAWTLLFAPQAPSGGSLEDVRRAVRQRGCGEVDALLP